MRLLAPALLALLLLAGCLQEGGSAPSTSTPAGGTTAGSTPAGSTPTSSTPPDTGTPPAHGTAVVPRRGSNATAGFTLEGNESVSLIAPGGAVTFTFVATNGGANTTALVDPCGGGNPHISIVDANGTELDITGPVMRCMAAAGFQPFATGQQATNSLTWDGKAWNGSERAPVAPGTYAAHGSFLATRDGAQVQLTLDIEVGVTDKLGTL